MWLDEEYGKAMRMISNYFLRKRSLGYIFGSKIDNKFSHIKHRSRIMESIKNPTDFNSIKWPTATLILLLILLNHQYKSKHRQFCACISVIFIFYIHSLSYFFSLILIMDLYFIDSNYIINCSVKTYNPLVKALILLLIKNNWKCLQHKSAF